MWNIILFIMTLFSRRVTSDIHFSCYRCWKFSRDIFGYLVKFSVYSAAPVDDVRKDLDLPKTYFFFFYHAQSHFYTYCPQKAVSQVHKRLSIFPVLMGVFRLFELERNINVHIIPLHSLRLTYAMHFNCCYSCNVSRDVISVYLAIVICRSTKSTIFKDYVCQEVSLVRSLLSTLIWRSVSIQLTV